MASSKLLKEAIADAKAVRETAIANAKIALEEAFTPRLQSILSQKLQAEMEGDEEDTEDAVNEDNDTSSEIGSGADNKMPTDKVNSAQTDLSGISKQSGEPGSEGEETKVKDLTEGEDEFGAEEEIPAEEPAAFEGEDMAPEMDMDAADEDELDLESIIRELEAQIAGEESEEEIPAEAPAMEGEEAPVEEPVAAEPTEAPAVEGEDPAMADDEIDLDEILREMGYGEDEAEEEKADDATEMKAEVANLQAELEEALAVIKSLKGTINEVNLLNAKLLYTNKLFRSYNLTNEQKVKVVENLDRTSNVREVKLVYATLSESMKFTGTERKVAQVKKNITEGIASKVQASTAPAKEIIAENTNELANRFKQLAGIIK
jgi:hypothetical protein